MDSVVFNVPTVQSGLVTKEFVVLLVDVIYYGLPTRGEREGGRGRRIRSQVVCDF